jgi:hypothetical protein
MPLILEGIVTTLNPDGTLNVAPMGPIVDESMQTLLLRPFTTSHTYSNLVRSPCGVFHVVDDVLLLARAAIDRWDVAPETFDAEQIQGRVLAAACRWYEFEIDRATAVEGRAELRARVVHVGRLRDVFGFNRAKHAVLEAAILATRVHILPGEELQRQMQELRTRVTKTAGAREAEAFELLACYIDERTALP